MRRCNTLQLLVQKEMDAEMQKKRKGGEAIDSVSGQISKKKK